MTTQPRSRLTADEFMAWAADQPSGRFELAEGEVVAMAPERAGHARVKFAVAKALEAGLVAARLPCEAMVDGMAVRIDDHTVFEPGALVRCGPRTPDDATELSDPVIVVEVVSPSSRALDSGAKLARYFDLPSVAHYLVIDSAYRAVTHHRRSEAGGIATQILRGGGLRLDPPGCAIDVDVFFAAL